MYLPRTLSFDRLSRSVFLFGPRQTGKTSLLKHLFADSPRYDLLETDTFFELSARPRQIRDELLAGGARSGEPVIVDEIQRLPVLLNEIQLLIDRHDMVFILTGSSARKLTRAGTNLLGGRARIRRLFPLTSSELGQYDLGKVLTYGTLPSIYFSDDPKDDLRGYCGTYLQQEIQQEGIVRKIESFSRFLRTAAGMNGELINYQAVADDSAVPARTVREYFGILSDTLIADVMEPYGRGGKRKAVSTGRVYFFDIGVANTLRGIDHLTPHTGPWGKALEHFVYTELRAWLSYNQDDRPLTFWRTQRGTEVDFVVGDEVAVEVKAHPNPGERHLKGLRAIAEEGAFPTRILVYAPDGPRRPRSMEGILILPVKDFLTRLWAGEWTA